MNATPSTSQRTRATPPLRICHLGKFYPPASGGVETHVQTLARAQARLGAEVRVLCINHEDREGIDVTWRAVGRTRTAEERDGTVRVRRLGRLASVSRLDLAPRLPLALRDVVRDGVDVLHLHAPNPTMLFALSAFAPDADLVITHHSDVVRQRVLGAAFRPFEHWLYRRAGLVLSGSEAYIGGSPLLQRYREKVETLPFGLDLAPFTSPSPGALAAAERLRAAHGGPLWLAVGRLVYYKGLDVALAALPSVPGKLIVVGKGPLEAELRERARSLGVADRVWFGGHLDDEQLVGAYHAATALWFPSNARSEGFGLAQVEAMASGCPVINTAVPHSGVSWVSPDGVSGLTVPVNDPGALAAAARRLVEEPGLRDRLARQARARALGEFEQGMMAERSLALYEKLRRRDGNARRE